MKDITPVSPLAAALGVVDASPAPSLPQTIQEPVEGDSTGSMPPPAEVDYLKARSNLYSLIQTSMAALEEVMTIASQTQDIEAYNSAAGLIAKAGKLNQDLVKLHEQRKNNKEEAPKDAPKEVHHHDHKTIVATSEDIQKMIASRG